MKKYRCECKSAKCEVEREDNYTPKYCTCYCTKEAYWQEVKEEEKTEEKAEVKAELPSWCKVGEVVYYTKGKLYCKIHEVDKKRGVILFNSEYLITDFVSISELAEARLRPFNETEIRELVGKVIACKTSDELYLVYYSTERCIGVGMHGCLTAKEILEKFTMQDGTPCGVCEHFVNGEWMK